MTNFQITIVTPTYNRADCIEKNVYPKLQSQSNQSFKWLIIDDGSTDNTRDIVNKLKEKAEFQIEYHWKENGGKHTALNYSYQYIQTEFFLILDSDEYLYEDAVENIILKCKKYIGNSQVGALVWQKNTQNQLFSGKPFPEDEFISNQIECIVNGGIGGEHFTVFRKKIAEEYPFSVFQNEKFIPETDLWIGSSRKYKFVFFNTALGEFEYLSDGLTSAGRKLRLSNPKGCAHAANLMTLNDIKLKIRFKKSILYVAYSLWARNTVFEIFKNSENRTLTILTFAFGFLLVKYWTFVYHK